MVHFPKVAASAALVASSLAAPVVDLVERQAQINDATILQFALTLEHLENTFYIGALNQFPLSTFLQTGPLQVYYQQLLYIAHDEQQHVELLTSALSAAGQKPVAACTYNFPYKTVPEFLALASILEGVGDAAYLGAAPAIQSKTYLGVAGSILVTEALHTAIQRASQARIAAASPYGSAITPNDAYTLAASFIVSCPSSNVALPFKAFPALRATQGLPTAPGITFTFTTNATLPSTFYVTFISGLTTVSQAATVSGGQIHTTIPLAIGGQTYAILTSANVTAISDAVTIAGPAILEVTPDAPTRNTTEF